MWHQLKCPAQVMSGLELDALLREIHAVAPFPAIVVSYASGAGLLEVGVPDGITRVARVNYDDCHAWLPKISQFDWGDFFLVRDGSVEALAGNSMEQLFVCAKASIVTVRAQDTTAWDVLTTNPAVIAHLQKRFGGTLARADELESLTHLTG
jgi:hypothetical protein